MNLQKPLVSVIVPNYNHARFLRQRIDSVLAQTYTNYELILLDDASTDESVEILESYRSESCIACICLNEQNTGIPFIQWKRGIELARGEYIWIAESDDYADAAFLATTVPLLEKHSDASFCFAGSYRVDESGGKVSIDYDRWNERHYSCKEGYRIFNGYNYILHNLYWRSYIYNASGVLFRKKSMKDIDTTLCFSMRCSGDWLFWTEMARKGRVIELYQKLNYCRYHQASTSTSAKKTGKCLEEDMIVVEQIEKEIASISCYKRILRHGGFFKKIIRLKVDKSIKNALLQDLRLRFNASLGSYIVERTNKILSFVFPWLLTEEKDRL